VRKKSGKTRRVRQEAKGAQVRNIPEPARLFVVRSNF
jgi:hypothetical protein